MSDRLDRELQKLMVKVMAMAPEPPPFPQAATQRPRSRLGNVNVGWSGWKIAFAAGWLLIVLIAVPILWLNRDGSSPTPPATVTSPPPTPSDTSTTTTRPPDEPQPTAAVSCTLTASADGGIESTTRDLAVVVGAADEITVGAYTASFEVVDGYAPEGIEGLGLLVDISGPIEPEDQNPDLPDGVIMRVVGGIFPDPEPGQEQVGANASDGVSFLCVGADSSSVPTAADPELLTVSVVEASSQLGSQWSAANLIDGDPSSDWQDRSLGGEGASFMFGFATPVFIDHILIYNLPSEGRFTQNHKIKSIDVYVDAGGDPIVSWEIPNTNAEPHRVPLGVEVTGPVRIQVTETYPSEPYDGGPPFTELAVAEIEFYGRPYFLSDLPPVIDQALRSVPDAAALVADLGLIVAQTDPSLPHERAIWRDGKVLVSLSWQVWPGNVDLFGRLGDPDDRIVTEVVTQQGNLRVITRPAEPHDRTEVMVFDGEVLVTFAVPLSVGISVETLERLAVDLHEAVRVGAPPTTPACSTDALDLELEPQPGLPAPVAATREAIFDAALACDYVALQALADTGDESFTASFGGGGIEHYLQLEQQGIPVLADMVRHLNQPYAAEPVDEATAYYTWPSAFVLLTSPAGDGLSDADYQQLLELYTVADLEEMFNGIGGYVGWRHGIADDGEWLFFVAGD